MAKIEIFTTRSCPYCTRAKSLLKRKGVLFNEIEVDGNPELIAESVKRSDGMRTVPQIFIEDYHVGGYDDLAVLDQNGKLDSLLGIED
ncbi:MAG: glutaredoxin 3 [Spirochaetales bacterium]|jgi:glutaredoxin 3|nr:glutaredoxin 3 [Spirochaetales bacterium]